MKDCKMMMIYINQSHKALLEEFLEEIHFYYYTVQSKVESVWSENVKHKNTHIWPGMDCRFYLWLEGNQVDEMLSKLKTFRAALPYNLVFSVGIIPIERIVPDLSKADDIEIDEELLEQLKQNLNKKKI